VALWPLWRALLSHIPTIAAFLLQGAHMTTKPKIRMQYRRSSAPTDQAVEFEIPKGPAPDEIQVISVTRREGDGFGQFVFDYEYVLIWR